MATTAAGSGTMGINVAGIKNIRSALESYKKAVESKVHVAASEKVIQAAIKGTGSEAAFKTAAKELNATVEDLLGFVARFDKQLTTIEEAYKAHDTGVTYNFKA